ncbi:MAG: GNAT family N-acetyltransferase [Bacteroidales bacterium]|nr:GNAT family N-acetyltransferase [Bacteroidales bacterium]
MLKGKKIELRAIEPSDVDLLYQWENDEEIWYLSNTLAPFSKFVLEQYVLNSSQDIFTARQLRLMIDKINAKGKIAIGSIDLFDFDPINKRAGIGILISKNERKKGHASEALQLLIDYCFDVLHLHQVYCNITSHNEISLQLFKKFNFVVAGTKRDWIREKNSWCDEYILQLIKS